jgi:hypothetical protein
MSQWGQTQKSNCECSKSASPPISDIHWHPNRTNPSDHAAASLAHNPSRPQPLASPDQFPELLQISFQKLVGDDQRLGGFSLIAALIMRRYLLAIHRRLRSAAPCSGVMLVFQFPIVNCLILPRPQVPSSTKYTVPGGPTAGPGSGSCLTNCCALETSHAAKNRINEHMRDFIASSLK